MATATQLTTKDAAVLSALFDPESSLTNAIQIAPETPSPSNLSASPAELQAIKLLDTEAPTHSDIERAISILDDVISSTSSKSAASAYSNRAQARRLLLDMANLTPKDTTTLALILSDLTTSITSSTPPPSSTPTAPIPAPTARTLSTSHTHRAYLLYLFSRPNTNPQIYSTIPSDLTLHKSKEELEELASQDFAAGGRYGSKVGREMSVRTNPYAKLCGSIVKEAMRREIDEFFGMEGKGEGEGEGGT